MKLVGKKINVVTVKEINNRSKNYPNENRIYQIADEKKGIYLDLGIIEK